MASPAELARSIKPKAAASKKDEAAAEAIGSYDDVADTAAGDAYDALVAKDRAGFASAIRDLVKACMGDE